jgi:arylsulfatase A-like enzyme
MNVLLAVTAVLMSAPVFLQGATQTKPNLLVVTFDTTRADKLGCYGFSDGKTNAIDRIAREGVLFEEIYAQAPQTMPNHTSLFTGLYTITHDVVSNGQKLADQAVTLAEILNAEGYQTGAVVAAAPLMTEFNLNQGFDYYNDEFKDMALVSGFKSFLRLFTANKVNLPTSRPAHRVTELAKGWLKKAAKKDKPFFLWVHFFDPHHPYEFHPDFDRPDLVVDDGEENEFGEKEKNYVNEIEFADYYLGKLLGFMEENGMMEDTLTVFTGDHGESLGEHDYRGHRQEVYQSIIRVPLAFRWPGRLPAGERLTVQGMTIDVTPTILKLLDIETLPGAFQGQDLFSLAEEDPRKIYSVAVKLFTKAPIRKTLIYGRYKYIEVDDPLLNMLFDLESDSGETANLLKTGHPAENLTVWESEIQNWFDLHSKLTFSDFQMTPEQLEKMRSLGYVQ